MYCCGPVFCNLRSIMRHLGSTYLESCSLHCRGTGLRTIMKAYSW